MTEWWEPVRDYCERTGPGVWAEPVNALSNAAFLGAAFAAARAAREARDGPALALGGLVGVIGLGSFLFHTLAVRWAMLADVLPIAVFIHAYFFLAMRRFLGLGLAGALGATVAFAVFAMGLEPAALAVLGPARLAAMNGSAAYLPALAALLGVGALLAAGRGTLAHAPRRVAARGLLAAAAVFAVSLLARTLDRAACTVLPFGTHALWHGLNAVLLWLLLRIAVRARA